MVAAALVEEPRHPGAHQPRHAVRRAGVEEGRLAVERPQRLVQVARRARGALVVLGHEGHRPALGPGDLLDRVLDDGVDVGRFQRAGIADVDLLLAGAGLALGVLHRHPRGVEAGADRPHHILLLGGLEDVVVLVIGAHRRHAAIAGGVQVGVGVREEEELQLRGHHRLVAHLAEPGDLALEHGARRMRHLGMGMVVEHVGEDQRGARNPGRPAQRREVGLHHIVAVARGPARRLVAGHRLHLEVGGEQVVAAVGLLVAALEEEFRLEALSHQPALHVDLGHHHRVDAAVRDRLLEVAHRQ